MGLVNGHFSSHVNVVAMLYLAGSSFGFLVGGIFGGSKLVNLVSGVAAVARYMCTVPSCRFHLSFDSRTAYMNWRSFFVDGQGLNCETGDGVRIWIVVGEYCLWPIANWGNSDNRCLVIPTHSAITHFLQTPAAIVMGNFKSDSSNRRRLVKTQKATVHYGLIGAFLFFTHWDGRQHLKPLKII